MAIPPVQPLKGVDDHLEAVDLLVAVVMVEGLDDLVDAVEHTSINKVVEIYLQIETLRETQVYWRQRSLHQGVALVLEYLHSVLAPPAQLIPVTLFNVPKMPPR